MRSTWASASRSSALGGCLVLLLALTVAQTAGAKVFHSQKEALALAFPDAESTEVETHVLTAEQARRVEELARAPVETKLVRIWRGMRGGAVQGYALIDVHTVRTHPEAFLVVLTPEGSVRSVRILAFHEPLDYLPSERWYQQFDGKTRGDALRVGGDVHGIVGATLSAQATAQGVRRALALFQVLIRKER
jgi:Na+-translocating ferredoxin:NAD+ oxidoreductase RnfG subunit